MDNRQDADPNQRGQNFWIDEWGVVHPGVRPQPEPSLSVSGPSGVSAYDLGRLFTAEDMRRQEEERRNVYLHAVVSSRGPMRRLDSDLRHRFLRGFGGGPTVASVEAFDGENNFYHLHFNLVTDSGRVLTAFGPPYGESEGIYNFPNQGRKLESPYFILDKGRAAKILEFVFLGPIRVGEAIQMLNNISPESDLPAYVQHPLYARLKVLCVERPKQFLIEAYELRKRLRREDDLAVIRAHLLGVHIFNQVTEQKSQDMVSVVVRRLQTRGRTTIRLQPGYWVVATWSGENTVGIDNISYVVVALADEKASLLDRSLEERLNKQQVIAAIRNLGGRTIEDYTLNQRLVD